MTALHQLKQLSEKRAKQRAHPPFYLDERLEESLSWIKRDMRRHTTFKEMMKAIIDHFVYDRPDVLFGNSVEVSFDVKLKSIVEGDPPEVKHVIRRHVTLSVPNYPYNKHRSRRLVKKMNKQFGVKTRLLSLNASAWAYIVDTIEHGRRNPQAYAQRKDWKYVGN